MGLLSRIKAFFTKKHEETEFEIEVQIQQTVEGKEEIKEERRKEEINNWRKMHGMPLIRKGARE